MNGKAIGNIRDISDDWAPPQAPLSFIDEWARANGSRHAYCGTCTSNALQEIFRDAYLVNFLI